MKKKILALLTITMISGGAFAKISDDALKFVPGGKIIQEKKDEVKVETPAGSVVEVEFDRKGKFEEASGDSIMNDLFVPGDGLMALKDAVAMTQKQGKTLTGEWSLDKSMMKGWYYKFEGSENGKKMDYLVDAKTGKILESKVDN